MEPLSTTASIVSITAAAIQSIQFLAKTIDNIKDAPDTVKGINADLQVVQPVLRNLDQVLHDGSSPIVRSSEIKLAVANCDTACKVFQSQVERWMRHSTEDRMFWVDRWKIGLFGPERIKAFKGQLSDCKVTLSVALTTATIITTSRQETLMKEMKEMMLQQNEAVVRQQLARADNEIADTEQSLQQFSTSRSSTLVYGSERGEELERNRQYSLQELRGQLAAKTLFRDVCQEALFATRHERTGQKIRGVKATNNSSALTGFINVSGEDLKIDQDISDIVADNYSVAVAGVINNLDFKDLRRSG